MNKQAAEQLAQEEIKKRDGVLNHTARELFLEEMNGRMALLNTIVNFEVKPGIDNLEFARTHTLTESMEQVEDFLLESARLFKVASDSFKFDAGRLEELAVLAKEIRESEDL